MQHICDMNLNWGSIYVQRFLLLPFMESTIPTNWYFLAFFVWSVNFSSLTFRDLWTVLKYYWIFHTVLYSKINFNWKPLFQSLLLLNKLYELNFFKWKNISNMSSYLSIIYIWGLLTCFHLNKESLIVTIKYVCSFYLVFKLCSSGLQIIHLHSNHLRLLGSVGIWGVLWWHISKDKF